MNVHSSTKAPAIEPSVSTFGLPTHLALDAYGTTIDGNTSTQTHQTLVGQSDPLIENCQVVALSNNDFMTAIFGEPHPDESPFVIAVEGNPSQASWSHGHGWSKSPFAQSEKKNNYFTLATFKSQSPPHFRRTKENFALCYGIYLDDVGTKAVALNELKLAPSYVIETSPENFQAGYLFSTPCNDLQTLEQLQKLLCNSGLTDPGAGGWSSRLGRLPVGINGKYDPTYNCRLVSWSPERRYSIDELIRGLGLDSAALKPTKSIPAQQGNEIVVPEEFNPELVLSQIKEKGLYKSLIGDGRHDMTCPWVDEHTNGHDHGSAYFEPSPGHPHGGYKCFHGHCADRGLKELLEWLGIDPEPNDRRAEILIEPGMLHSHVQEAEIVLASTGQYFQRGGMIVNVAHGLSQMDTRIIVMNKSQLTLAVSRNICWKRYNAKEKDYLSCDPPPKYIQPLHEAGLYEHLPVLNNLVRQPYLAPDGSILDKPGYDPVTGMYGVFEGEEYKLVTEPTEDDARNALSQLRNLIKEFSFASPVDESAALAMILTAAIRASLALAPMGHVRAPQIASGKSYLCSLIAAFATNTSASAYDFPSSEEECHKLLVSALLQAPAVLMFDNLTSDLLAYKSLCSALTSPTITGRILGESRTVEVATQTLFLSSGNNVEPVKDMTRRTLTIHLDPKCENPAQRHFESDPLSIVMKNRPHFVGLALTLIRAYIVAGKPDQQIKPLASFMQWTELIRSPLVWTGMPDPAKSLFDGMNTDPDREVLGRLLFLWHRRYGDRPTGLREVLDWCLRIHDDVASGHAKELVQEIAGERGEINNRRFGHWLKRHAGRIVDGLRFERTDAVKGGSACWRVVNTDKLK